MHSKNDNKRIAASLLQEDIMNGPMHCFGSHHKCRPEYCKIVRSLNNNTTTSSPGESTLSSNATFSSSLTLISSSTPNASFSPNSSSTPHSSLTLTPSSSSIPDTDVDDSEVEAECLEEFLEQQQQAWEDATATDTEGCLDSTFPIDEQMICDIKAIAS